MTNIYHRMLRFMAKKAGFGLNRLKELPSKDMDVEFKDIYQKCENFSMTSLEQMYALYKSVEYITKEKIEGDFVECGVWKGGSSMLIAETLSRFSDLTRKIYLYDTFEGMPRPEERDIKIKTGTQGIHTWNEKNKKEGGWCNVPLSEVQANMYSTKYPEKNVVFIKGKVEETIPQASPEKISLLRLDTDWYSSTYHELKYLYPRLTTGGILIIDDYGSWSGSKDATNTYFSEQGVSLYLHRLGTARVAIKTN